MKGSRHGPQALLEASANMELYDIETDSEVFKRGIVTLPPMRCPKPPSEMVAAVYDKAVTILEEGKFLVGIGGEHTVSVGLVRAAAERYRNLSVIQFDAHSDRRDTYGGEKYSHACVMARIGEICPFVQVGIRSMDVSEKDVLDSSRTFFAHDIINGRDAVSGIVDNLSENVYLSVDLDVFDPSVMPSTGTPEPGGLDWQTINELIASVVEEKNVVAADITELLPHPSNRAPDFLAAKLLYRILSMVFCGK
jgi:agmatinase